MAYKAWNNFRHYIVQAPSLCKLQSQQWITFVSSVITKTLGVAFLSFLSSGWISVPSTTGIRPLQPFLAVGDRADTLTSWNLWQQTSFPIGCSLFRCSRYCASTSFVSNLEPLCTRPAIMGLCAWTAPAENWMSKKLTMTNKKYATDLEPNSALLTEDSGRSVPCICIFVSGFLWMFVL
jgi:hypothetical protein